MEEAGLCSEGGSRPGVDVMLVVGQMAHSQAILTEKPERRHNRVALCVMLSVETDEIPLSSPSFFVRPLSALGGLVMMWMAENGVIVTYE